MPNLSRYFSLFLLQSGGGLLANSPIVAAETKTTGKSASANLQSMLAVTWPGDFVINIDMTDISKENLKSATGTINVVTNNPTGYTLTAEIDGTTNDLTNTYDSSYTIPNLTSTTTAAAFPVNHWGYAVGNLDNFSPFPTTVGDTIELNTTTGPAATSTTDFSIATKINAETASGTYINKVKFTAVTNAVPEPTPTWDTMTEMQQMTPEICASQPTPTADQTNVPTKTLTDARDGKTYTISKLADGECWMTDNLALELDSTKTYTKDDTDLNSEDAVRDGWTPERSTGAAWSNDNNNPYSLIPSGAPAGSGVYYNWTAAVASNDTSSHTTQYENMPNSICPKGWRLPIMDGTTDPTTNQLANLWIAYGWEGYYMPTETTLTSEPLNFVLAGDVVSGSLYDSGAYGYLWSPVVYSSSRAYRGYFRSAGLANPDGDSSRHGGQSVRCVAR